MKHTRHNLGLTPQLRGSNAELPFPELLALLGRTRATGVVLVRAADGHQFELRLAGGQIVRLRARAAQNATQAACELAAADRLTWSFRPTRATPAGAERLPVDRFLFLAAFALAEVT